MDDKFNEVARDYFPDNVITGPDGSRAVNLENPADQRYAAEEYLARLAEQKGVKPSWWRELLQQIRMGMARIGFLREVRMTDPELETLIARSVRATRRGRFGEASRVEGPDGIRFSLENHLRSMRNINPDTVSRRIQDLIDAGFENGNYRARNDADRAEIVAGARRFFDDFSSKVIPLSDGRNVYFAPDARSEARVGGDLNTAWAEYAIHAVTSSGKLIPGKGYAERLFNRAKLENLDRIEEIIRQENVFGKFDAEPAKDAVIFSGTTHDGKRLEIITRLDEYGNVNADLTEVTVVASKSKKQVPPLKPLAEVVEAVAQHQAAGFSPSTSNSIVDPEANVKQGAGENTKFSLTNQTETPEFKRWFGDSKVVDENGKPLVVYHGSESEFFAFDPERTGHSRSYVSTFFFS